MGQRIADFDAHVPGFRDLVGALVKATGNGALPSTTTSLVFLRAGHVVGSTYQVLRHSADLRGAGESEARIGAVATWWDAPYFTDAERAALALTDAVFQPSPRSTQRVPDELWDEIAKHYDDKARATLVVLLSSAAFWMSVALIAQPPPIGQPA